MSRKIKNILMIVLLIVLLGTSVLTVYFAKEDRLENIASMGAMKETQNVNPNKSGENTMMEEPPAKPEGDATSSNEGQGTNQNGEMTIPEQSGMQNDGMNQNNGNVKMYNNMEDISGVYYLLFIVQNLLIAAIIMYLVMSKFNKRDLKRTFYNLDKIIIFILSIVIITGALTILEHFIVKEFDGEESTEKTTSASDVDKGVSAQGNDINLNDYTSNVTITKAGTYNISGSFENSILIDADGDVTLNLKDVTIKSSITSAIANISENELVINVQKDTENTLSDGGSSEYDGCIYSTGKLTITGDGSLMVYGNQEEGEGIATTDNDITIEGSDIYIESADDGLNAGGDSGGLITINDGNIYIKASGDGIDSNDKLEVNGGVIYTMSLSGGNAAIDTDGGYKINGGTVVALGSDMMETPKTSSKQNTISFNLGSNIASGTLVTLVNGSGDVIVSFEASTDFKTLIISSSDLKDGNYYLYKDGKNSGKLVNGIYTGGTYTKGDKISVSDKTKFNVDSVVTKIS